MHEYIGAKYWYIGDAPFVGSIGGFASVFVTASFACTRLPFGMQFKDADSYL
jgi:amino acid permease